MSLLMITVFHAGHTAEKAKRGHKNAQARERALLREAEGLAATENSGMYVRMKAN